MEKLGIDPALFISQVINFVIIMYVLQRFAYKPLLRLLDKRREEIASSLAMKEEIQKKLEEIEDDRKKVLREARDEARRVIKDAVVEAKKQSGAYLESEKENLREERVKMLEEVAREREKAIDDARKQSLEYAVLISEKLLVQKLDEKEQQRLLASAVRHVKKLIT